jgi:hypothetical protein
MCRCATSAPLHLLSSSDYFLFAAFIENSRFFFDCRPSGMAPGQESLGFGWHEKLDSVGKKIEINLDLSVWYAISMANLRHLYTLGCAHP